MKLNSNITNSSAEFRTNYRFNKALLQNFNKTLKEAVQPKVDDSIKRHKARGKLTARERIAKLSDVGSSFLEIGALAGLGLYDGVRPGAGLVTGIARVSGRECMIVANDATVKGGTYFPMTVKKHLRAQEIAMENNLPCIYLVDSGGAFLPLQDQVFPDRDHFGRIFYNQARMSSLGIAQIAVVMGSCTAGGAYVPAMSDEAIIVKNQGTIFLGGPPLVKAATGEEISAEELGGADTHCRKSGVADHYAENDEEALTIARRVVANLGAHSKASHDVCTPLEPLYDPDEIFGLIPQDTKKYFPIREILARLLDASEFDEFKALYGNTIVCGFGRFNGYLCGIIANDGILFSASALKATHFIELCDQRNIPLVFLQNIVGFMVGRDAEHGGIAKDGAKMVHAVSCARVAKYTVILGASYGAGNYGMAGRAFQPRTLFAWPNAKTAVMGATQAANVLTQVKSDSAKGSGKKIAASQLQKYHRGIEEKYNQQSEALYSTARLWDDGIIDPTHTSSKLALALSAGMNTQLAEKRYGIFRM